MNPGAPRSQAGLVGRKRNPATHGVVLRAALDLLAEVGFAALTMDALASRAGVGKPTLYRRWPSKVEVVTDAVAWMAHEEIGQAALPDTGTLRGDLVALMKPSAVVDGERRLRVMRGLASIPEGEHAIADTLHASSIAPWVAANAALIDRAIARREFGEHVEVAVLAQIIPSMCAYRVVVEHKPIAPDFILALIDSVLLPALRGAG